MVNRPEDWKGVSLANGRYLITTQLGEGGMGYVYRALDRNIDAEVVIKIPRQALMDEPEFAGRFTQEIRSLVKLSHPHIVKVTDVGEWEGTPFAVMQYLPGGSLEDERRTGPDGQPRPCDAKLITRWLDGVAGALDYIHSQGYIHRDVKPGNILFDANGHAFLSDFGVAKVLAAPAENRVSTRAMTGAGMVLGTPEYMAPELIMGEVIDGRVDQYALAVTTYELLCGRRPFEHETKTKVLVLHTSAAPPRLTDLCPALSERLSLAVLKGLSKDRNERYPTCAALATAVAGAVEGAPARDDRVRLKCRGCGKTGLVAAADWTRLIEAGRRPTCSACKSPLEVFRAGAESAATATGPSGTKLIPYPSGSGECLVAPESAPVAGAGGTMVLGALAGSVKTPSPDSASSRRGSTVAVSALENQGAQALLSEPRPGASHRGSQTLIEHIPPRLGKVDSTQVLQIAVTSPPEAAGARSRDQRVRDSAATAAKVPWIWLAVGAGALVLLLLFAFGVSWLGSRQQTSSMTAAPIGKASPTGAAPQTAVIPSPAQPVSKPAAPVQAEAPMLVDHRTRKASGSRAGPSQRANVNERPDEPDTPSGEPKSTRLSAMKDDAEGAPSRHEPPSARPINKGRSDASIFATHRFDPARLEGKPLKPGFTLQKTLSSLRSYSDQIIVPAGMYLLAPSQSRAEASSHPRKYLATAQTYDSKNNVGGSARGQSISSELEVEPNLAAYLDQLQADDLEGKVAILTLWVPSAGSCGLVKVEILQKFTPRRVKVKKAVNIDIDYETLSVTSQGSKLGFGIDEEWEEVGRMHSLAKHYKDQVRAMKKQQRNSTEAVLMSQMNDLFNQSMRAAALEDQRQQQLRRQLLPR